ncbi:MAG: tetratricopeptide repeat protein [bacterium]
MRWTKSAGIFVLFAILVPFAARAAENAALYFQRGNEFVETDEFGRAIIEYEKAISISPFYKEAYNAVGNVYAVQGVYDRALQNLNKAIEIDPRYVNAYINMGLVYEKMGRFEDSIRKYGEALAIEPNNKEAHLGLAQVYRSMELLDDALASYDRVSIIDPGEIRAYLGMGDIWLLRDDPARALEFYQKAVSLDENNALARLSLGFAYQKMGEERRALDEYVRALQLNDRSVRAYELLGLFYLRREEWDQAIAAYKNLVNIIPTESIFHYTLGLAYERKRDWENAIEFYERAFKLYQNDEIALHKLENALRRIDEGKNPSPRRKTYAIPHILRGDYYYSIRQIPLALIHYRRAVAINPQDAYVHFRLSQLYEYMDLLDESITELRKSLELDPSNIDARDRLEFLLRDKERRLATRLNVDQSKLPDTGTRLAVFDFVERGQNPYRHLMAGQVVAEMIRFAMGKTGRIQVVGWDEIQRAMERINVLEVSDFTTAVRVAKEIGAEAFLFGEVSEKRYDISISARLGISETEVDIARFVVSKEFKYRVQDSINQLAQQIIDTIPYKGYVLRADEKGVLVDIGVWEGIRKGMELVVLRQENIRSEQRGFVRSERELGRIRVRSVDDKIADASYITPELVNLIAVGDIVRVAPTDERAGSQKKTLQAATGQ